MFMECTNFTLLKKPVYYHQKLLLLAGLFLVSFSYPIRHWPFDPVFNQYIKLPKVLIHYTNVHNIQEQREAMSETRRCKKGCAL